MQWKCRRKIIKGRTPNKYDNGDDHDDLSVMMIAHNVFYAKHTALQMNQMYCVNLKMHL